LVENFIYRHHHKMFPVVTEDHKLAGYVGIDQVKKVPREEWGRHTVGEVLERSSPGNTIRPDCDAAKALSKRSESGISRLLVADGARLVAIVSMRDLLNFLEIAQ